MPIYPRFTTVVDPDDYNIDKDMQRMVKLANTRHECYCLMDVGKVYGLYLAWKELKEANLMDGV